MCLSLRPPQTERVGCRRLAPLRHADELTECLFVGSRPEVIDARSGPIAVISTAIGAPLTRRWLRSWLPVACELLRFGYLSWGHPPFGHFYRVLTAFCSPCAADRLNHMWART